MKNPGKYFYKISDGNLMMGGWPIPQNKFNGPDSKSHFQKNLETKPADWHYRTKEIVYNCNSYRYRQVEEIPDEDFILFLGCSHTFGVGLAEDELYCRLVSDKLQMPYVNGGVGAAGRYMNTMNLTKILQSGVRPALVINQWPSYGRTFFMTPRKEIMCLGPWIVDNERNEELDIGWDTRLSSFYKAWIDSGRHDIESEHYVNNARLLLGGYDIPYFEFGFYSSPIHKKDINELLGIVCINLNEFQIDLARDDMHLGPKTHEKLAEFVRSRLPRGYK